MSNNRFFVSQSTINSYCQTNEWFKQRDIHLGMSTMSIELWRITITQITVTKTIELLCQYQIFIVHKLTVWILSESKRYKNRKHGIVKHFSFHSLHLTSDIQAMKGSCQNIVHFFSSHSSRPTSSLYLAHNLFTVWPVVRDNNRVLNK